MCLLPVQWQMLLLFLPVSPFNGSISWVFLWKHYFQQLVWVLYGLDAPSSFATSSLTAQSHRLPSQSSYFLPQGLCMSLWLGFLPCTLLPAFFLTSNSSFRFDLLEFLKYSSFLGHSYILHIPICDYLIVVYFPQRKEAPRLCLFSFIPRASSSFWHNNTLFTVESVNEWKNGSCGHHIM